MKEKASDRTSRYIESASCALKRLKTKDLPMKLAEANVKYVVDLARGYVKDSKHYREKRKLVTSLACVAYAEGLLDALKFLELVDF